jgi:hypothetical protein
LHLLNKLFKILGNWLSLNYKTCLPMLLQSGEKLEEHIVQALARKPAVTASWLHRSICERYQPYTLQAVYQELRKLQRAGVVVKAKDEYSLRLAWVLEMLELTDAMYEGYMNGESMREVLPGEGKQKTWRFHDLHSLSSFYAQLGLFLLQRSKAPLLLEHVPHVWYHFAHSTSETQFVHALHLSRCNYYFIVRNDTYLDRTYRRYFAGTAGEMSFGKTPFSGKMADAYFMVIDDVQIKLTFDAVLQKRIGELFQDTRSAKDIEVGRINDIFHARARITLTLEHNAAKAAKLRRRFLLFFGATPNSRP